MDRPTFAEVKTWLSQRKAGRTRLDAELVIDEQFYTWSAEYGSSTWKAYVSGFPADYKPKLPSVAYLGVQRAANNIVVGETPEPEVTLPDDARGSEDEKKQQIAKLRAWYKAVLFKIDTYSTETPLRDFFVKMLELGAGILAYPINWVRWEDPPHGYLDNGQPRRGRGSDERMAYQKWARRRQRAFPWDVYSEHIGRTYFDLDHDPPWDWITEDEVNATNYADKLDLSALALKPSGGQGRAKRLVYVSDEWYGCWVENQPLLTSDDGADEDGIAPNSLGMAWERIAYSGLGDKDATGDMVVRCQGIIRSARDAIVAKLLSLNIKLVVMQKGAYQELMFSGPGAELLRDKWAEVMGPGGAIADESGNVKITLVPTATLLKEIFEVDREIDQQLEMVLGPEILEGIYRPETASGQRSRASFGRAPYRAPQQSGQQCIAAMLMDMSQQVKDVPQFRGGVTVQGVTLRPADVVEHFLKVNIAPPTEEDRAFKRAAALDDLKAGLISEVDAIRETRGIEDAEATWTAIRAEQMTKQLLEQPAILEYTLAKLTARLGIPSPSSEPVEGVPPAPMAGEQPLIQEPEPTLGSPGDIEQQVGRVLNQPLLPGAPVSVGP